VQILQQPEESNYAESVNDELAYGTRLHFGLLNSTEIVLTWISRLPFDSLRQPIRRANPLSRQLDMRVISVST